MTNYLLNIDADEILYKAAFTAEQTAYKVFVGDKVYDFGTQYSRQDLINTFKLKEKVIGIDYTLETYKVANAPVSHAIQNCKRVLEHLSSIGAIKLWLTSDDKSNFRFSVAKTPGPNGAGYKAGRPSRPIYYQEVREYLIKKGAEEVTGIEADDALGIHQTDNTIAVHQDKDINRISGRHYNYTTRERYVVEQPGKIWLDDKRKLRGHGDAFFFAQMLMGDRVDNIPTVVGLSANVAVERMLQDCKAIEEYYAVVEKCFKEHYNNEYKEKMYEMADLLYIMDSEQIRGNEYIRRFE